MKSTREIALNCVKQILDEYYNEEKAFNHKDLSTNKFNYDFLVQSIKELEKIYSDIENSPCPANLINYGSVCGIKPLLAKNKKAIEYYCLVPKEPLKENKNTKFKYCSLDSSIGQAIKGHRTDDKRIKLKDFIMPINNDMDLIVSTDVHNKYYDLVEFYRSEYDFTLGKKLHLNFYEEELNK